MGTWVNMGLQENTEMGSNVPIFLSIVNKFHNSIIGFDRPTLNIAFGGKIKIVNFFKQLDF